MNCDTLLAGGHIMSIIAILLIIAIIGVIVWLITQAPMPPVFRNVIIGVAVLLLLLWLLQQFGGVSVLRL
jgi:hypothetical protein